MYNTCIFIKHMFPSIYKKKYRQQLEPRWYFKHFCPRFISDVFVKYLTINYQLYRRKTNKRNKVWVYKMVMVDIWPIIIWPSRCVNWRWIVWRMYWLCCISYMIHIYFTIWLSGKLISGQINTKVWKYCFCLSDEEILL